MIYIWGMESQQKQPRRIFSVWIYEKPYDVYDIAGKEHGGYNGTIKTWWLYFADPLPDGVLPPIDSEHWHPFQVGVERRLWHIHIKQHNTTKEKWGDLGFRSHTSVQMWCNSRLVYEFGTIKGERGIAYAMAKIQYLQTAMSEHPYNFFEPEEEQGRKIWWYGLPATVRVKSDGWEIGIVPDYTTGFNKAQWWQEYRRRTSKVPAPVNDPDYEEEMEMDNEDFQEAMDGGYINWGDALSDKHIDWFRK